MDFTLKIIKLNTYQKDTIKVHTIRKTQWRRTTVFLLRRGLSRLINVFSFVSRRNSLSLWGNTLKSSSERVWLHNNKWYFIGLSLGYFFVGYRWQTNVFSGSNDQMSYFFTIISVIAHKSHWTLYTTPEVSSLGI